MKVSTAAIALALGMLSPSVTSYPGELIYSCAPAEKEWDGPYTPWDGNTKNAHSHLTFDDGPVVGDTDAILDALKEYDIKATFFLKTADITDETRYLVERMMDEVRVFSL